MDIGVNQRRLLNYLGAYALGMVSCIVVTPVELILAGKALWLAYALFAPFGYVSYYVYLTPPYVFGSVADYWLTGSLGLLPVLLELVVWVSRSPLWCIWRPLWFGFPVGYVGTLGVYYTVAASI